VGRRRKNAGLDRGASLEKSERWLREALNVPARADAEDGDDAAFARDVELMQVLLAQVASESPHFWKAWRTLGARRAMGTFEQGAAAREEIAKTTARSVSPAEQRVASLLAALEGHLVVFVVRENALLANPAADLVMPRAEKRLPRAVLSPLEADTVMNQPNVADPIGLRDRAMLETLYSTGMRRSELLALKVDDIDIERCTVMIRLGKGRKDRLIPIGERAAAWIDKYLREVRATLATGKDEGILFLTELGESMIPEYVTHRMRRYVEAADVGKKGACHIFRHTMATAMLENGADVRYVQEMLGHVSLSTTQIYTRVSIKKLQQIHAMTHPAARLERRRPPPATNGERHDIGGDEARAELFSSLAAEAAEDSELDEP
jgi:integrase/recombinase XerD